MLCLRPYVFFADIPWQKPNITQLEIEIMSTFGKVQIRKEYQILSEHFVKDIWSNLC
jgi:hypothetical protein